MIQFEEEKELRAQCEGSCTEDDATHTFQYAEFEYLLCCNETESILQRILDGEAIPVVMFEYYRGEKNDVRQED